MCTNNFLLILCIAGMRRVCVGINIQLEIQYGTLQFCWCMKVVFECILIVSKAYTYLAHSIIAPHLTYSRYTIEHNFDVQHVI